MKRAFIMVLDSFGIGATEDADRFGDVGSDTMGHIAEACAKGEADNGRKGPLNLPNLTRLGLVKAHEVLPVKLPPVWTATRTLSALTHGRMSSLQVKTPRQATGKSPAYRFSLTGAISPSMKTASRRSFWINWLSAPTCRATSATVTLPVPLSSTSWAKSI